MAISSVINKKNTVHKNMLFNFLKTQTSRYDRIITQSEAKFAVKHAQR